MPCRKHAHGVGSSQRRGFCRRSRVSGRLPQIFSAGTLWISKREQAREAQEEQLLEQADGLLKERGFAPCVPGSGSAGNPWISWKERILRHFWKGDAVSPDTAGRGTAWDWNLRAGKPRISAKTERIWRSGCAG